MATYTLITVTHSGEVRNARGFESLRMCQEARSIALTGMTIAQAEEADRVAREQRASWERQRQQLMETEWRKRYPPRLPTESESACLRVMQLVWAHEDDGAVDDQLGEMHVRLGRSVFCADGLVHDEYKITGYRSAGFLCSHPRPDPGRIRVAHCVIELPDEPAVPLSKLTPGEAA